MAEPVSYRVQDNIATITMDDGKVNALSPAMLAQLDAAFDQAERDRAVVILTGRDGVFSAGFDLEVLRAGGPDTEAMLRAGFELAARLLAFPTPVIGACTGHAVAMAAFLLLSVDYRVGAAGSFRITANEVAIGLTLPHSAIAICRQRLNPPYFHRAAVLAETFTPDDAIAAGFLDRTVAPADVRDTAIDIAQQVTALDMTAHAATKLRVREPALVALRAAIDTEMAAYAEPTARR